MEHVLRYADIDTRRALGVYRRLPIVPFTFRPIPPIAFRYWPEKQTVMYTNFYPDEYEFTVYRGITHTDDDMWSPCEIDRTRKNSRGDYIFSFSYIEHPFYFAGIPDII